MTCADRLKRFWIRIRLLKLYRVDYDGEHDLVCAINAWQARHFWRVYAITSGLMDDVTSMEVHRELDLDQLVHSDDGKATRRDCMMLNPVPSLIASSLI